MAKLALFPEGNSIEASSATHKAAYALFCLTGLTLWESWGADLGFQVLPFGQAFLYASVVTVFVAISGKLSIDFRTGKIILSILALTVSLLLTVTYAPVPLDVVKYVVRYIQGVLLLATISSLGIRRPGWVYLFQCLTWGSVFAALITIAGAFSASIHALTVTDPGGRSQGPFNYSNQLGLAMAMACPLFACQISLKKPLYIIPIGLLAVALLASGSKTNFILFAYNLIAYAFIINWVNGKAAKAWIISIGIVAVMLVLSGPMIALLNVINPGYFEKISQFANAPMEQGTTTGRIEIYDRVINFIWYKSIFGIGAGNEIVVLPLIHAHNVFMDVLLCAGVPGFALLLVLLFFLWKLLFDCVVAARRAREGGSMAGRFAVAGCVSAFSYFCSNQVSDSFGANTLPIFWMLIALIAGLTNSFEKQTQQTFRRPRPARAKVIELG